MLTLDYVGHHLRGAFLLLMGNDEGFDHFDLSYDGFWNSFWALGISLVILVPSFIASHQVALATQSADRPFAAPLNVFVIGEWMVALFAWVTFLYVMRWVAVIFGAGGRYATFVITYNWASLLAILIALPVNLAVVVGLAGWDVLLAFEFMLGIVYLVYFWYVYKRTLDLGGLDAAAVVLIEIFVAIAFTIISRLAYGYYFLPPGAL